MKAEGEKIIWQSPSLESLAVVARDSLIATVIPTTVTTARDASFTHGAKHETHVAFCL